MFTSWNSSEKYSFHHQYSRVEDDIVFQFDWQPIIHFWIQWRHDLLPKCWFVDTISDVCLHIFVGYNDDGPTYQAVAPQSGTQDLSSTIHESVSYLQGCLETLISKLKYFESFLIYTRRVISRFMYCHKSLRKDTCGDKLLSEILPYN